MAERSINWMVMIVHLDNFYVGSAVTEFTRPTNLPYFVIKRAKKNQSEIIITHYPNRFKGAGRAGLSIIQTRT